MGKWAPLVVPEKITGRVLDHLLGALTAMDEDYLREHPKLPDLYNSGVRYKREKPGEEKWLTIPWVMLQKNGDCEDLACWRAAELRVRYGEAEAMPIWSVRKTAKGALYHIRVRRASGRIEDPSALLGMGQEDEFIRKVGPKHGIDRHPDEIAGDEGGIRRILLTGFR